MDGTLVIIIIGAAALVTFFIIGVITVRDQRHRAARLDRAIAERWTPPPAAPPSAGPSMQPYDPDAFLRARHRLRPDTRPAATPDPMATWPYDLKAAGHNTPNAPARSDDGGSSGAGTYSWGGYSGGGYDGGGHHGSGHSSGHDSGGSSGGDSGSGYSGGGDSG